MPQLEFWVGKKSLDKLQTTQKMSDTPETDRYVKMRASLAYCIDRDAADFARRLERERDEARRELQSERDLPTHLLDVDAICKQRDEARRERDAIKFDLDFRRDLYELKVKELHALKDQLDDTIAALETIASLDFVITLPDRMDAVRDIANKALNNIKQHKK
jgi:vacuolar-type H+-ATPase subunit I/STV1